MKQLTLSIANQEHLIIQQKNVLSQKLKRRATIKEWKVDALEELKDCSKDRFARLQPKEYMNDTFDFFGGCLRMTIPDQKSIVKHIVFKRQEKEIMEYKTHSKIVRNECETLKVLLEQS